MTGHMLQPLKEKLLPPTILLKDFCFVVLFFESSQSLFSRMNLPLYREFESTHFISILLIYEVLFVVLLTSECCCGSTWIQRFCSCLFLVLFPFPYFKGCFNLHILSCFNFCDSVICRILSISCKDFHFNRLPIFFLLPYFFKFFCDFNYIIYQLSFLFQNPHIYIPLFFSFKPWPLFSFLHTYMYLCAYSCFHRYNQLYLYNFACMPVFRVHYLILDSQLVYSSMGKTISPTINILWFRQFFRFEALGFPQSINVGGHYGNCFNCF